MRAIILSFLGLLATVAPSWANEIPRHLLQRQTYMLTSLDTIESIFDTTYAPREWKRQYSQWDLKSELDKAREEVRQTPAISLKRYQSLLKKFFNSTKDYHVGFSFIATERATLPLAIRGAQGRYFIAWVDRKKLSEESFPFKVGDEVIKFDGKDTKDVVAELKQDVGDSTPQTDESLAQSVLTNRRARLGVVVPKGPVSIVIKKGDALVEHQLVWEYTEEVVRDLPTNKSNQEMTLAEKFARKSMASPLALSLAENAAADENPFIIGSRRGFLPDLGTRIWETDKENPFDAYIFLNADKKLIGVVRIPSYGAGEKESEAFEKILKKFSEVTDGLVIDQLNNPGGSVFYLYSLASMLTDKAIYAPRHLMSLTQGDILEAAKFLKDSEKITNDEEAQKHFGGKTVSGYPVSMTFVTYVKEYSRFLISEWNEGRTLTRPYFLWGADKINAHPRVNYTKPVLLLVNELDFSGGDFFPAILQDNKRVTVMGTRTAGAGGYVNKYEFPNLFGLEFFSTTGSLAKRVNDNPIENLGVTPDVPYDLTPEDFQNGFKDFVAAIQKQVQVQVK